MGQKMRLPRHPAQDAGLLAMTWWWDEAIQDDAEQTWLR